MAFPHLTDIAGLRTSGIFPAGREPSIRTLREWTRRRRIPYHKLGHFVYFDPVEIAVYIHTRLRVPPRGESPGRSCDRFGGTLPP